jgi:uracil-DNA glycosylase
MRNKLEKVMNFQIEESWRPYLEGEFKKPYMAELLSFLDTEKRAGKEIYPDEDEVFEAFRLTPFSQVKVVILGQDPYHGAGQAHGLCFSVKRGVKAPPSLVNIFKELKDDLGIEIPDHGCLESWAQQGVLLLNTVLTVEVGKAGSHHQKGWEKFTDKVIEVLNQEKENLVFILWGTPAQKKASRVDETRHLILKSVHPSPLSVYRGFMGSKPFSETNKFLKAKGLPPIDWTI